MTPRRWTGSPRSSRTGIASQRKSWLNPVAHTMVEMLRIPIGRVTTYGAIARALGEPCVARSVGWALHLTPEGLPCHRVVNRHGFLSGGWHFGHLDVMASMLHAEAVPFRDIYQVDLEKCLWEPDDA